MNLKTIRSKELAEELSKVKVTQFNNFKGSQIEKTIDFYLIPYDTNNSAQLNRAIEKIVEKLINEFPTGIRYFISIKSHMLNLEARSQLLVKDTLFPLFDSNAIHHLSDLSMLNHKDSIDAFTAKITIFHEY